MPTPIPAKQANTITAALLNQRTSLWKRWHEAKHENVKANILARIDDTEAAEREFRRLQDEARGCRHLSNILTEEGYECHDCGFITRKKPE